MQAARVKITERDDSFSNPQVLKGISGMTGIAERGKINDPSDIITSPAEYRRLFGGTLENNDFPAQCLRVLEKGGKIRVNNIRHYTDIANKSTLTALAPTDKAIKDAVTVAQTLYTVVCLNKGVSYNNLKHEVTAASNGLANYFNLRVYLSNDVDNTLEVYENLTIPGYPTVANSKYLDLVNQSSALIRITYSDLSGISTGNLRPDNAITAFTGGVDGGAAVTTDYAGDAAAGTGFFAFDPFDDMMQIASPSVYSADINQAGGTYCANRGDMIFFAHINPALTTTAAIIAERALVTVDTKYIAFFSGGITIKENGVLKQISEIADVIVLANNVDENYGPWYSLANTQRGKVFDALGVTTNFGSTGQYEKLNLLAQRQINMMINRDGMTYLSGNFTGQLAESKASFLNVTRALIYLKKTFRPILSTFLEEPTDLVTFRDIYRRLKPTLDNLVSKRALYGYTYQGDQDVKRIQDVVVNTLADLNIGKYKIKLKLDFIAGLQEIELGITLTRTGELFIEIENVNI